MTKKTSRKARTKTPAASAATTRPPVAEEANLGLGLRGELIQLAEIRGAFAPLTAAQSAAYLKAFTDDACRERAKGTKAEDVFRGAMSWARKVAEYNGKPGVNPLRTRWFLDCATSLGNILSGKFVAKNPSEEASYDDVVTKTAKLAKRTARHLRNAAGDNAPYVEAVKEATRSEGQGAHAVVFRKMAALIKSWRVKEEALLAGNDIDADTVTQLEAAAGELEAATARRPVAQQGDKDTPEVNQAEGRVLFAMRPLWNDAADAREDGKTGMVFTTSPALLRGLALRKGKRKGTGDGEEIIEDDDDSDEGQPQA